MFKYLIKDFKKHYFQYLILAMGMFSGVLAFFLLTGRPLLRATVVILLGFFYFSWGTIHHLLNHDWHFKISLEYLLVAMIASGLLLSMILRG